MIERGLGLAMVVLGALALREYTHEDRPAMPDGICLDGDFAIPANARIAAVIGAFEPGIPVRDPAIEGVQFLDRALTARGFRRTGTHYERRGMTIDVVGPIAFEDVAATSAAIQRASLDHDVIYYTGHSYDGTLALPVHRTLVLDTCWSAQLYGERLVDAPARVVVNTERSVAGSIESLVELVDGESLATLDATAEDRLAKRSQFPVAERYGVLARCRTR